MERRKEGRKARRKERNTEEKGEERITERRGDGSRGEARCGGTRGAEEQGTGGGVGKQRWERRRELGDEGKGYNVIFLREWTWTTQGRQRG